MKNNSVFSFVVVTGLVGVLLSCGVFDQSKSRESSKEKGTSSTDIAFTGFVVSAFDVTVDGSPYADLEEFYTLELGRLPAKVEAAGYDASYAVRFDAEVGFNDLWQGMSVYLAPTEKRGFQGTGKVGSDGKFSVRLPQASLDAQYKLRANKRISVVITKGEEHHKLCYNFSAVDKSVLFAENEKPIILDTFKTSLTTYDCAVDDMTGGLDIPSTSAAREAPLLKKSMTREQVLDALGRDFLEIRDVSRWCWSPPVALDTICGVPYASDCRCRVEFDPDGLVVSQDNIRSDRLDVSGW